MDPEEEIRLAAHAQLLPEEQITGHVDESGWSLLDDLLATAPHTANPTPTQDVADARSRLAYRARRAVADPAASLLGLAEGGTLGWADELGAATALSEPDLSADAPEDTRTPAERYQADRSIIRDARDDAQSRNPEAYGSGEVAGMLLPLLFSGGESSTVQAPSFGATIGRGVAEGAGFGALAGAGESDASGADLARDTATSALLGGAMGGALSTVPAGARAARARGPQAREAADLARVASVGGGRGTISRTDPRIAEFARLPGGIPGQAARIRRLGIVGPASSISGTAERAGEVLDRTLADGAMTATRDRIAASGQEVPVSVITDALEREAQRAESLAATSPFARRARALADRFRRAHGDAGTVPYATMIDELGRLRRDVPWSASGVAADASRGRQHAMRDALDQWVEGLLGPEEAAAYREGRLDYQTARTAADQARERAASAAGNRGLSLTDTIAGASGQSLTGSLARMLLNRGWRMHEPALRATGAEVLARLLSSVPELATRGGVDQLAGRVAPELLEVLRGAGASDEPEASAAPAALEEDDGGFIPDEAEDEGGFVPDEETP